MIQMGLRTLSVILAASVALTVGIQDQAATITTRIDARQIVQMSEQQTYTSGKIRLVAHRGLATLAPENTLPAIQLAGERGFFACEFDVFPTSDGVWVVNHDCDVSAMTDASGNITDYTYAELMEFTVDAGANVDRYPDLKLCTLEEALDTCLSYGMYPVIEIKSGGTEDIASLVQIVKEKNLDGNCYIISYDLDKLKSVRTYTSKTMEFYLTGQITQESIDAAVSLGNAGLDFCCYSDGNTAEIIAEAKEANLPLFAWGTSSTAEVEWLYSNGVFAVTVDGIVP